MNEIRTANEKIFLMAETVDGTVIYEYVKQISINVLHGQLTLIVVIFIT